MTDNEIIKALICCCDDSDGVAKCAICPFNIDDYQDFCVDELLEQALAIINRQQAKIEALQMDNEQLQSDIANANMNAEHALAEIARLKRDLDLVVRDAILAITEAMQLARVKAIKEFVERLIADLVLLAKHEDEFRQGVILGVIHTVEEKKKEMVGDSDA